MNMTSPFGLGDLAYYLFRPAVYVIDWTWGTDLRDCQKCKKRRKSWNRWGVPRWVAIISGVTMCALIIWWGCES